MRGAILTHTTSAVQSVSSESSSGIDDWSLCSAFSGLSGTSLRLRGMDAGPTITLSRDACLCISGGCGLGVILLFTVRCDIAVYC